MKYAVLIYLCLCFGGAHSQDLNQEQKVLNNPQDKSETVVISTKKQLGGVPYKFIKKFIDMHEASAHSASNKLAVALVRIDHQHPDSLYLVSDNFPAITIPVAKDGQFKLPVITEDQAESGRIQSEIGKGFTFSVRYIPKATFSDVFRYDDLLNLLEVANSAGKNFPWYLRLLSLGKFGYQFDGVRFCFGNVGGSLRIGENQFALDNDKCADVRVADLTPQNTVINFMGEVTRSELLMVREKSIK